MPFLPSAQAAEFRFGVNAAVSYNESEFEVRRRYNDWLTELGKAVGHKLVFVPIYSDRVEGSAGQQAGGFFADPYALWVARTAAVPIPVARVFRKIVRMTECIFCHTR